MQPWTTVSKTIANAGTILALTMTTTNGTTGQTMASQIMKIATAPVDAMRAIKMQWLQQHSKAKLSFQLFKLLPQLSAELKHTMPQLVAKSKMYSHTRTSTHKVICQPTSLFATKPQRLRPMTGLTLALKTATWNKIKTLMNQSTAERSAILEMLPEIMMLATGQRTMMSVRTGQRRQ